nr:MAG TPA: hypothetical protein [Bacteriophage sp.]
MLTPLFSHLPTSVHRIHSATAIPVAFSIFSNVESEGLESSFSHRDTVPFPMLHFFSKELIDKLFFLQYSFTF